MFIAQRIKILSFNLFLSLQRYSNSLPNNFFITWSAFVSFAIISVHRPIWLVILRKATNVLSLEDSLKVWSINNSVQNDSKRFSGKRASKFCIGIFKFVDLKIFQLLQNRLFVQNYNLFIGNPQMFFWYKFWAQLENEKCSIHHLCELLSKSKKRYLFSHISVETIPRERHPNHIKWRESTASQSET